MCTKSKWLFLKSSSLRNRGLFLTRSFLRNKGTVLWLALDFKIFPWLLLNEERPERFLDFSDSLVH